MGELDGNAVVKITNSEKVIYTHKIEKGTIQKDLGSDWYTTECHIEYIPENVTKGSLKFEYKFHF